MKHAKGNITRTIDEAKAHCSDVGHDIEKAVADGVDEIVGGVREEVIKVSRVPETNKK